MEQGEAGRDEMCPTHHAAFCFGSAPPCVLVFASSITHRLQTFFSVSVTGAQTGRETARHGLRSEGLLPKDMADFN